MSIEAMKERIKSNTDDAATSRWAALRAANGIMIAGIKDRESDKKLCVAELSRHHRHRTHSLRKKSRATLIAYGFLRGREYSTIEEPGLGNEPDWAAVKQIVSEFSPAYNWDMDSSYNNQIHESILYKYAMWAKRGERANKKRWGADFVNVASRASALAKSLAHKALRDLEKLKEFELAL